MRALPLILYMGGGSPVGSVRGSLLLALGEWSVFLNLTAACWDLLVGSECGLLLLALSLPHFGGPSFGRIDVRPWWGQGAARFACTEFSSFYQLLLRPNQRVWSHLYFSSSLLVFLVVLLPVLLLLLSPLLPVGSGCGPLLFCTEPSSFWRLLL